MKKIFLSVGLFCGSLTVYAQQQFTQISQYVRNPMLINPAAAGISDNLEINLGFRNQWTGFSNLPRTFYLNGSKALVKQPAQPYMPMTIRVSGSDDTPIQHNTGGDRTFRHAVGGVAMVDTYGSFLTNHFSGVYAGHLPVGEKMYLSVGAQVGVSNTRFNENLKFYEPNDPTYTDILADGANSFYLDAGLGGMLYSDRFFIGYSAKQLLQNKIYDTINPAGNKRNVNHFLSAGYTIKAGDNLTFTPSVLAKFMSPLPFVIDFNLIAEYKGMFWGGLSYRHVDAAAIMVGLNYQMFRFGYSYDYSVSGLNSYNSGSHEVLLGVSIGK